MNSCLRTLPLSERNAHKFSSGLPQTPANITIVGTVGSSIGSRGVGLSTFQFLASPIAEKECIHPVRSAQYNVKLLETCHILNNFFFAFEKPFLHSGARLG